MSAAPDSLDQELKAAELKRLQLHIEQLEAEKRQREQERLSQIEAEQKPWYYRLNYLQLGTTLLVILPVVWFYLTEVISPSLETQNIQAELASAKLEQDLRQAEENLNQERTAFQAKQDSLFDVTARRTQIYRTRIKKLEEVKISSLRLIGQIEEENNKGRRRNYLAELRTVLNEFEAGDQAIITALQQAIQREISAYVNQGQDPQIEQETTSDGRLTVAVSDLENFVFSRWPRKTIEQLTLGFVVDGSEQTYTILAHAEVLMSEKTKANKLKEVPEGATYQLALDQFQQELLEHLSTQLNESVADSLQLKLNVAAL